MQDKYSGIWLSHSSISNFQKCPRAYYLATVYRDPRSGNKLALTSPSFSLGRAVHDVLESLSTKKAEERFRTPLLELLRSVWTRYSGEQGGFASEATEKIYYERASAMLKRVEEHQEPLTHKAVKIKMNLPSYWLSKEDNLILCGRLDWLQYMEDEQAVHIIDFKTGKSEESETSLQLPIYYLLAHNCQIIPVKKASYWYLERNDTLTEKELPSREKSEEILLKIGKEIKLARSLERFKCKKGDTGCATCTPYEKILQGEATYVGQGEYGTDLYAIFADETPQVEIL